MAHLSDGSIAMLDVSAPYLHIVSSTGKHLRSFLGAGEGPGKARMPLAISVEGPNLWVWDAGNRRLTLLSRDGKILREVPLRVEGNVLPMGPNRFLVVPMTGVGPGMDSLRAIRLAILDSIARPAATLFTYRDVVRSWVLPSGSMTRVGGQPLQPAAFTLTAPGGNGIAVVFPTVEERAGGTAFRLVRFAPSGVRLFDRWIAVRGVRVSPPWIDAVVRSLSIGPDSLDPGVTRRVRAALTIPKYLPAASVGFVGQNGETWLRDFSVGREERGWFVVSSDGEVAGRIAAPKGERILGLLGEQIVTTWEDVDGEPRLSLSRILRRP